MSISHAFFVALICIFLAITCSMVRMQEVSLLTLSFYLGAIVCSWLLMKHTMTNKSTLSKTLIEIIPIIILTAIGLGILWYFGHIPMHYHQDEFITAYTSLTLPELIHINWFGVYPAAWVSQFPVLFHILQKPFFLLFGATIDAIRMSVFPYYVGIMFYMYALSNTLNGKKHALISVTLLIFFSPMIYLSSMGLHFISSTFFYIAMAAHIVYFVKSRALSHAWLAGLYTGLSYLTYTSSYVAFPVALLLYAISPLSGKDKIKGAGITTAIAFIILAPFFTYAYFVNNFFLQRISQVNAVWGTWSDIPEKMRLGTSFWPLIRIQIRESMMSLYIPNIGGLGGYNFGNLALMEPLTALLFTIGFLLLTARICIKRTFADMSIFISFLFPFITGFILTTHPPPFHRISIIYPFFALIIALPIASMKYRALWVIFILYGLTNIARVNAMISKDSLIYPQNSRVIADYLLQTIPLHTHISIASYPAFYLGQELTFRLHSKYALFTDTTETILQRYAGEPLILLNAKEEILEGLQRKYPAYTIRRSIDHVSLGDLTLFSEK